jgi:integrase
VTGEIDLNWLLGPTGVQLAQSSAKPGADVGSARAWHRRIHLPCTTDPTSGPRLGSQLFTLAEARQILDDPVRDKRYQQTPLGALIARYLDRLRFDNYSDRTVEVREPILARLALRHPDTRPEEFTYRMLVDYMTERTAAMSVHYRRQFASTLRVFFDWCLDEELIPADPARKLRSPRSKDADSTRRAFDREFIRQLVSGQQQRRDRLAIELVYTLALRRVELSRIRVRDFDFANLVVTIYGKGGTVLPQHIPARLAGEIEMYLREIDAKPDWYFMSPQKQIRTGRYPLYRYELRTTDPTKPYSLDGITCWFQRCRQAAGLEEEAPVPHELRHSGGTHFHQAGGDLVKTQHYMRHKNISTTANTYIHLDRAKAVAEVQEQMPGLFDDATTGEPN